jgi:nucleoside 2-deoxyribosyltransferase
MVDRDRVYLAARYARASELFLHAMDLVSAGFVVTSRWIRGDHQASDEQLTADPGLAERFAAEDVEDLRRADIVISFTEEPRSGHSRGGRHVEFGMALALGKRVLVVGHRENVFHCLPQVEYFETWEACLDALAGREARVA